MSRHKTKIEAAFPFDAPATFLTNSPEETRELAEALGKKLKPGDCVLLCGPLGAGKTLFTQGLAKGMGVESPNEVVSPTFVMMQEYSSPKGPLIHVDLYRCSSEQDWQELGLDEILQQGESVVVIEWGDKREHYHVPVLRIDIKVVGDEEREIRVRRFNIGAIK